MSMLKGTVTFLRKKHPESPISRKKVTVPFTHVTSTPRSSVFTGSHHRYHEWRDWTTRPVSSVAGLTCALAVAP